MSESATLIKWEPRYQPPVIDSTCPSCGRAAQRTASSWWFNIHTGLHAKFMCRPGIWVDKDCYQVYEVNLPDALAITTREQPKEVEQ